MPGGRQSMFVCEWALRSFPDAGRMSGGRLIALAGRLNAPLSCRLPPEVVNNYLCLRGNAKMILPPGFDISRRCFHQAFPVQRACAILRRSGEPAQLSELIIGRFFEVNTRRTQINLSYTASLGHNRLIHRQRTLRYRGQATLALLLPRSDRLSA